MILRARHNTIAFPRRPLIVGSVTLSHAGASSEMDSRVSRARVEARHAAREGADVIVLDLVGDVAATERSNTNAAVEMCSAFVQAWKEESHPELLGIQNVSPDVAMVLLPLGCDFLMHTSSTWLGGGRVFAALCAQHGAGLIAAYNVERDPALPLFSTKQDPLEDAEKYFEDVLLSSREVGLSDEFVVLGTRLNWAHPASTEASLRIGAQIKRFQSFGRPLLLSDFPSVQAADCRNVKLLERHSAGMVARVVHGMMEGVHLFHAHDVGAAAAAVRTIGAVLS